MRLIPPQYAKPCVKRNKTDAADAEAIWEVVGRPTMRFVPIKTKDSEGLLALHRARSLLVRQRTATINSVRGLLGEFGLVGPKGVWRLVELGYAVEEVDTDVLPEQARAVIADLFGHLDALTENLGSIEREILAWHKTSEESQSLATAPGAGLLTATAQTTQELRPEHLGLGRADAKADDLAPPSVERAVAIPVAAGDAAVAALVPAGADHASDVGLQDQPENTRGDGAQEVALIMLLKQLGEGHVGPWSSESPWRQG